MITKIIAAGGFSYALNLSKFSRVFCYLSLIVGILASFTALATQQVSSPRVTLNILDSRSLSHSSNGVSAFTPNVSKENLLLQAQVPESVDLPKQVIEWRVYDEKGRLVRQLQGQDQLVRLATGHYQVQLSIGQFIATKLLAVKAEVLSKPYFKANIGHLVLEANHITDWSINSLSHTHIRFDVQASEQVDMWAPSGAYEISSTQSGVMRRQVVNVLEGEMNTLNMNLPLVKVNLIAVENNQPLLKPVEWAVFRLEKGERYYVGRYYQHSQGITIPAGYYEVVATHAATVRSRQFLVKENTSNRVILAMD